MSNEVTVLAVTAASIGFFHTLLGPDHYVPFIVMAKARKWSPFKTAGIVTLCGLGHVGSSVILGLIGIGLGITVSKLEAFEASRGGWAAWGLIAFGLLYFAYGVRRAIRNRPHAHSHHHRNGAHHTHVHSHTEEHAHVHEHESGQQLVPWTLFLLFVFGPCEPLIPLLMFPAARHNLLAVLAVTGIFAFVTIATMLGMVLVATLGIRFAPVERLERYTHAFAGFAILLCGCAIQFMGL